MSGLRSSLKMQFFVHGETITTYDLSPSVKVSDLKELISFRSGVPVESQVLTFSGHCLDDEKTLSESYIDGLSTVHLGVKILGGKKF